MSIFFDVYFYNWIFMYNSCGISLFTKMKKKKAEEVKIKTNQK